MYSGRRLRQCLSCLKSNILFLKKYVQFKLEFRQVIENADKDDNTDDNCDDDNDDENRCQQAAETPQTHPNSTVDCQVQSHVSPSHTQSNCKIQGPGGTSTTSEDTDENASKVLNNINKKWAKYPKGGHINFFEFGQNQWELKYDKNAHLSYANIYNIDNSFGDQREGSINFKIQNQHRNSISLEFISSSFIQ